MKSKDIQTVNDIADDVVKTKRKSNNPNAWKNSPVIGDNGFMTSPGDNSNILKHAIEMAYRWPPIDTGSDEEIQERIIKYFQYCFDNDIKPGVEGMALAIGVDRRTLWNWETERSGTLGNRRSDIIKKSKQILADYMENLSQNGKINPVTAIFLMKNHFNYADKTEVEITPRQPLGDAQSPDAILESIEHDIPIDME